MLHRKRLQINEIFGAGRGGRTPTRLPSADFESAASASSAIPALLFDSFGDAILRLRRQHRRLLVSHSRFRSTPSQPHFNLIDWARATPRPARHSSPHTWPAKPVSPPPRQRRTAAAFSGAPDKDALASRRRPRSRSHPGQEY